MYDIEFAARERPLTCKSSGNQGCRPIVVDKLLAGAICHPDDLGKKRMPAYNAFIEPKIVNRICPSNFSHINHIISETASLGESSQYISLKQGFGSYCSAAEQNNTKW